jgi:hypothetical protein
MRPYLWIGFAEVVVALLVGVLGLIFARATRQILSYRGQPLFEKSMETAGFTLGLVFAAGTLAFADVMIVLLSNAPRVFVKLMQILGLHLTQLVIGAVVVLLGFLAYKFKASKQSAYGAVEIMFAAAAAIVTARQMSMTTDWTGPAASLGATVYVVSRGLSNYKEGVARQKGKSGFWKLWDKTK